MIGVVAAFAVLLALGGHAVVPWRTAARGASGPPPAGNARPVWSLAALPLLLAAAGTQVARIAERPEALAAGADPGPWVEIALRSALVLVAAAAAGDLLALAAGPRLERSGWWLLGGIGLALCLAGVLAVELLRWRLGSAPGLAPVAVDLLTAAACHAAVAIAAGEALAPGRPLLAPLGALGLPLYWISLAPALRAMLLADGLAFTTGAAAALFAAARWLPPRLRRPALVAAALLAALLFATAVERTALLPLAPVVLPAG